MSGPLDQPENPAPPADAPDRNRTARDRSQVSPTSEALLEAQIRRDLQGLGMRGDDLNFMTEICIEETRTALPYPAQPFCPIEDLPRPPATGAPGGTQRRR